MDKAQRDLNLQSQQLSSDYKRTGEYQLLEQAEYLRSEYETWGEDVPPAEL